MKKYHIAIGPDPNIMRRTSREVSGDIVLGFAFHITDENASSCRIRCDMLTAGTGMNESIVKACLNTLCCEYGQSGVQRAVESWLQEMHHREVPAWLRN